MACIENDGSEMAADLKRDFLAGGGNCHFFMCPVPALIQKIDLGIGSNTCNLFCGIKRKKRKKKEENYVSKRVRGLAEAL